MILPVQTTFRNIDASAAVAARVQEEANKLDKYFDREDAARLRCSYGLRVKTNSFLGAPSERGDGFTGGPLSPNLAPHTTSALLSPMDPWTHGSASFTERMKCKFLARSGLVIAPGSRHVGGHGQASPSPQTATLPKSSEEIERCVIATFRVAESMGFKGDFRQWEHLLRIGD